MYFKLLLFEMKQICFFKLGSMKINVTTKDGNKKQIETELSTRFTNSRDCGSDWRKKIF